MKQVKIYATGSCNPETQDGYGHAILSYNGAEKHVAVAFEKTSPHRCILHAVIAAVRLVKKPCALQIVVATAIGTSKPKKSKNGDLLKVLSSEMKKRGCTFNVHVLSGGSRELQSRVVSFFRNHPNEAMPVPQPIVDVLLADEPDKSPKP